MNFLTITTLVHDKDSAVRFLQGHGLLHQMRVCKNGHHMILSINSSRWRCSSRQCRSEVSLRKGTWLEWSKVELRTVVLFVYCWTKNLASIKFCSEELSMSPPTTIDWKNCVREVCAWSLLQTPVIVGGDGLHVEMDETLISHRKNQPEKVLPQQWYFGGICRETKEVFMASVADRSPATLMEIIRASIAPGSIIISDIWPAYPGIENMLYMEYTLRTVDDDIADPVSKKHTQTSESCWHVSKMQNQQQCGLHRALVDSYLCEFVWRQRYRDTDLFAQIMTDLTLFSPPQ